MQHEFPPQGHLAETLSAVHGALEAHAHHLLDQLAPLSGVLNWWLPPRPESVPESQNAPPDACSLIFQPAMDDGQDGRLWLFDPAKLLFRIAVKQSGSYRQLVTSGLIALGLQHLSASGLHQLSLGGWLSPGRLFDSRTKEDKS